MSYRFSALSERALSERARATEVFPQVPAANHWTDEDGALGRQACRATDILTVGPDADLNRYLKGLFARFGWAVAGRTEAAAALEFLNDNLVSVVVCEQELPDATWRDVLAKAALLPGAPSFLVAGDEPSLWSEVTHSGGFDVLVRPFRKADVLWTVASAWHHWMTRNER